MLHPSYIYNIFVWSIWQTNICCTQGSFCFYWNSSLGRLDTSPALKFLQHSWVIHTKKSWKKLQRIQHPSSLKKETQQHGFSFSPYIQQFTWKLHLLSNRLKETQLGCQVAMHFTALLTSSLCQIDSHIDWKTTSPYRQLDLPAS